MKSNSHPSISTNHFASFPLALTERRKKTLWGKMSLLGQRKHLIYFAFLPCGFGSYRPEYWVIIQKLKPSLLQLSFKSLPIKTLQPSARNAKRCPRLVARLMQNIHMYTICISRVCCTATWVWDYFFSRTHTPSPDSPSCFSKAGGVHASVSINSPRAEWSRGSLGEIKLQLASDGSAYNMRTHTHVQS